jgi:hypothetical protein
MGGNGSRPHATFLLGRTDLFGPTLRSDCVTLHPRLLVAWRLYLRSVYPRNSTTGEMHAGLSQSRVTDVPLRSFHGTSSKLG